MKRLDEETAQEIVSLFQTISDSEKMCDYLMSDAYLRDRDINKPNQFWALRSEWANAHVRLAGTFNICLPMLEYAEKKIDFFEDKKHEERKENARKNRVYLESIFSKKEA